MYFVRMTDKIKDKLSVYDTYAYYCLALCTDFNKMVSNATQETLARYYFHLNKDEPVKDSQCKEIKKHLDILETNKFIKVDKIRIKGEYGYFNKNKYKLTNEHFFAVSNKLYDEPISKELKGFLILLKSIAINTTNKVQYSLSEMELVLKYSRRQISKYIKELKDRGYIKQETKGISIIREELFPVFGTKIDMYMKRIEEIIQYPNFQLPKSYQQYIEAKKNNFKDIRDMESFLRYVIVGIPYKTKKENIKQSYTITL